MNLGNALLFESKTGILKYEDKIAEIKVNRLKLFRGFWEAPGYTLTFAHINESLGTTKEIIENRINVTINRLRSDLKPVKEVISIENIQAVGYRVVVKENI